MMVFSYRIDLPSSHNTVAELEQSLYGVLSVHAQTTSSVPAPIIVLEREANSSIPRASSSRQKCSFDWSLQSFSIWLGLCRVGVQSVGDC